MREATQPQLDYIDQLLAKARVPRLQIGDVVTMDDASAAIEYLHRLIPLQVGTRQAIFAKLRETKWTKEDLYQMCEIESLSDGGGATEFDGKKCLRFLETGTVEKRAVEPDEQLAKTAAAVRSAAPTPEEIARPDFIPDGVHVPFGQPAGKAAISTPEPAPAPPMPKSLRRRPAPPPVAAPIEAKPVAKKIPDWWRPDDPVWRSENRWFQPVADRPDDYWHPTDKEQQERYWASAQKRHLAAIANDPWIAAIVADAERQRQPAVDPLLAAIQQKYPQATVTHVRTS